jgi:adenine-specific DNA methylase
VSVQLVLPGGECEDESVLSLTPATGERALENEAFPFERLSDIAEIESWRKEIYRPAYHVHKWWAQRLGSVFRAVLLGAFTPRGAAVEELFYEPVRLPGAVVFDPFMGSGTTIGEALKLGARAIGRDINPVAHRLVRTAVNLPPRRRLFQAFRALEQQVAPRLRSYYRAQLPGGDEAEVLYYFWVKQVDCPSCTRPVDLFSSYVFAQHAYPSRYPEAQIVCPSCGALNVGRFDAQDLACASCQLRFDPQRGPARRAEAVCPSCIHPFPIAHTVRSAGGPPRHRLYAKLVLTPSGHKQYFAADEWDRELYARAEHDLSERGPDYPDVVIAPGYNTNQAISYGYTRWHHMFNARQLLGLGLLGEAIRGIDDAKVREAFLCLFSSALEFNNLFTSFKGEGTGAVRHMFAHHVLKPERMPLEANLWGTPRSSGSFSTLFERRILRAHEYCESPFEVCPVPGAGPRPTGEKVYGLSGPQFYEPAETFRAFREGASVYLSCGDSARTDVADEVVDAVITDPPFFDNVHYSELADFFHVWQRHLTDGDQADTTRAPEEVQAREVDVFSSRLSGVWRECHRVLKRDGLLVFSYHHSRTEGWRAVLDSLVGAGFVIVQTHPIKAEMSGATPKRQAREPIDLDILIVCRKREAASARGPEDLLTASCADAAAQLERFLRSGRSVSRGDVRIVVMAQVIRRLSRAATVDEALDGFDAIEPQAAESVERLYEERLPERPVPHTVESGPVQMGLAAAD